MDKRNKTALAYLLIGVAAAGRALLAVPEAAAIQEVSLTVLALVGYLLLAGEAKLPIVFGAAGLVLELILSGAQSGGAWVWLEPALRAVDLWLFWGAALVLLRLCGKAASKSRLSPLCRWPSTPWRIFCRPLPPSLPWPLWRSVSSCFGSPPA